MGRPAAPFAEDAVRLLALQRGWDAVSVPPEGSARHQAVCKFRGQQLQPGPCYYPCCVFSTTASCPSCGQPSPLPLPRVARQDPLNRGGQVKYKKHSYI